MSCLQLASRNLLFFDNKKSVVNKMYVFCKYHQLRKGRGHGPVLDTAELNVAMAHPLELSRPIFAMAPMVTQSGMPQNCMLSSHVVARSPEDGEKNSTILVTKTKVIGLSANLCVLMVARCATPKC